MIMDSQDYKEERKRRDTFKIYAEILEEARSGTKKLI
jgi:hypothetical protein